MSKIKVRNWDRWQSYRKGRGLPPWIKLHRSLLRNVDWITLTDEQRGQLVSMWMLAADDDGKLPEDAKVIQRLCQLEKEPDLNLFKSKGFIDFGANVAPACRQDDANMAPPCRQHGALESESEYPEADSDTSAKAAEEVALDPRAEKVTHLLRGLILENDVRAKVPEPGSAAWRSWVGDIHKINRLDKREWEEIDRVVRWCQADPFWKSNILSPSKLRKQFTTLMLKSQGGRRMEGFNERYA